MADPDASSKSWWATLPGILTALAGIITALAGLLAVLGQQGVLGGKPAASTAAVPAAATPPDRSAAVATGSPAPLPSQTVSPSSKPGLPVAQSPSAVPGTPSHSPAEVVAGLRARGFKGLAVTAVDGSVISLPPNAEMHGQAFPLASGQSVQFDRIVSVEIEQPWDGRVKLTLTNGQQLATTTGSYTLSGTNELGRYMATLPDIRRIDFIR